MSRILRYAAVAIVLIAGYIAMTYMQQRFDDADLKKAIAAVQKVRPQPASSETIAQAITTHYGVPAQQIRWTTEIESKWWGRVRVTAHIPNNDDSLSWLVDVAAQRVMPETEAAKRLF